jgi:hypothetical protein
MKPEPMRVLGVAALLVGPDQAAKNLKARWDRRLAFYPAPAVKGPRGKPSLYNPQELVAAAARAGDVSSDQVRAAHDALRLISQGARQG